MEHQHDARTAFPRRAGQPVRVDRAAAPPRTSPRLADDLRGLATALDWLDYALLAAFVGAAALIAPQFWQWLLSFG